MAKEPSQPTVYANTQAFPQTAPIVRTQFVANCNSVGFARKKAHTISFVERGFERLGPGHQAVGFSWCSCMIELSSPLESFSWRWAGRLWFLALFPSLFSPWIIFPFISTCSHSPTPTCRFDFLGQIFVPSAHT